MKGTLKQSGVIRKGQAATEFLMTYGWAILAIVIVAAVLWNMGVFKGQCAKTAAVQVFGAGEQLQASDWAINSTNDLNMKVKNLAGNAITISAASFADEKGSGTTLVPASVPVPAGGDATIAVLASGAGNAGDCFNADLNLTYAVTNGVDHQISGSMKGKY